MVQLPTKRAVRLKQWWSGDAAGVAGKKLQLAGVGGMVEGGSRRI